MTPFIWLELFDEEVTVDDGAFEGVEAEDDVADAIVWFGDDVEFMLLHRSFILINS